MNNHGTEEAFEESFCKEMGILEQPMLALLLYLVVVLTDCAMETFHARLEASVALRCYIQILNAADPAETFGRQD